MRWAALLLLLVGTALAQLPTALGSDEAVAAQIEGALASVEMVVPSLWSQKISEALRRAAQNRGVTIRLVVQTRYAEAPDAYTSWHALQGTASVRLDDRASGVVASGEGTPNAPATGSYLLIDDAVLVDGPFVSSPTQPFDARDTYAVRDPGLVEARLRAFEALWGEAVPFSSFVDTLEFTPSAGD